MRGAALVSGSVLWRLAAALVVAVAAAQPLAAQQRPSAPELREAWLAWDRGDYVDALERYLAALDGPMGQHLTDEIALATGELYSVVEVAPDGSDVAWGRDGSYARYEVTRDGGTVTEVVEIVEEEPRPVARLDGRDAVLSSRARAQAAYVTTEPSPELEAARDAMEAVETREEFLAARAALTRAEAAQTRLRIRSLETGEDREVTFPEEDEGVPPPPLIPVAMDFDDEGTLYVLAATHPGEPACLWALPPEAAVPDDTGICPTYGADLRVASGGRHAVYRQRATNPLDPGSGGEATPEGRAAVGVADTETWETWSLRGDGYALSADGSTLAWWFEHDEEDVRGSASEGEGLEVRPETWLRVTALEPGALARAVDPGVEPLLRTADPAADFALSPNGRLLTYRARPFDDWEVYLLRTGGEDEPVNLTKEIQHDLFPRFLDNRSLLAVKGEGRHRRSFVHDVARGTSLKLFHNNTVRTIAPEYEWAASPGGGLHVLVVSERDGDTVSPERGVYLVRRARKVSAGEVRERLRRMLASERALREHAEEIFGPVAAEVRDVVGAISTSRIFDDARALFEMGSKYITEPGNRLASEYIAERLRAFGYEPELQWFEPREGVRTANVIARLPGTVHPDAVYVASSHYDSVRRGPGADDNSSGTTALLEAARVMREHPQAATIEFAFFTGEEAGLLGSREYVRRAQESGKGIVGALNNDMVGWAENHRLDNTIRYSNAGIRDIQHGAAMLFTDLITYDALYYKFTDAHAYYEAYGDIVGGIGSHPVLANPHYHQATDRIETIHHQLVAEVGKTTAATLVLLAASPSRPSGLRVEREGDGAVVSWDPPPERRPLHYEVRYERSDGTVAVEELTLGAGMEPAVRLGDVRAGSMVEVQPTNERAMPSWDVARARVPAGE